MSMETTKKLRLNRRKAHKVVKPKTSARATALPTHSHKFRSFNSRIASLNINALRRSQGNEHKRELSQDGSTYFGRSLQEWRDLNMSQTFAAFASEVAPLCESLAAVIHNERQIMELVTRFILKADALALEPLLDLLSHFAHDLDVRFEVHFMEAISTVLRVASQHSDPAVIEWSFTCLSWLFKYLSRLLKPDLRPLYELLAPYLGREVQKPFVVRFTAEAMSFLLRKAATGYETNSSSLDVITSHVLLDCAPRTHDDQQIYLEGVMTLLTEAIVGTGNGVHSSGLLIIQSLFKSVDNHALHGNAAVEQVLCGSVTCIIHHCDAETFQPILKCILASVTSAMNSNNTDRTQLSTRLLFTIACVRKGSRVQDWNAMVAVISDLAAHINRHLEPDYRLASSLLAAFAVSVQHASSDAILSARSVCEEICTGQLGNHFLRLCDFLLRLDLDKFNGVLMPSLKSNTPRHLRENKTELLALLSRLTALDRKVKVEHPPDLVEEIIRDIRSAVPAQDASDVAVEQIAVANLSLAAFSCDDFKRPHRQNFQESLLSLVKAGFPREEERPSIFQDFALGRALSGVLDLETINGHAKHFWMEFCRVSPSFVSLPIFWTSVHNFIDLVSTGYSDPPELESSFMATLEESLIQTLSLPSQSMRKESLNVLRILYELRGHEVPSVLLTAITIESLPITLETARSISMNIRKIAADYGLIAPHDPLMARAIPTYCFGLLHMKLSEAWDDATDVLSKLCQYSDCELEVIRLAESWLLVEPQQVEETSETPQFLDVHSDGFKVASAFECPNLAKIEAIRDQVFSQPEAGNPSPVQKLYNDHKRIPIISANARSQALKVLRKTIRVAEKHSRMLVPILLNWKGSLEESTSPEDAETTRWSRKDQKSLLAIFAEFTNPKVLYKSTAVYDALLQLCANGDVEIQQSALKAIFAWKNMSVTRYDENLKNLLDDTRFREEISVFLKRRENEDDDGIKAEDEATLMPVLLHVLYGRAVGGSKDTSSRRRKAIFSALAHFGEDVLGAFLDIALLPFPEPSLLGIDDLTLVGFQQLRIPYRKQLGSLNMINEMLVTLGSDLQQFVTKIVVVVVQCTLSACDALYSAGKRELEQDQSLLRSIRHKGMQCLAEVYTRMTVLGPSGVESIILERLVVPRLSTFESENLQSVSAMLRLFSAWSRSPQTAERFFGSQERLLTSVAGLLGHHLAKDEVRIFVLQDILANLVLLEQESILRPYVSKFVTSTGHVVEQQPSKNVLDATIKAFSDLAAFITDTNEAKDVIHICTELLTKPSKAVSPSVKADLLRTIDRLVVNFELSDTERLHEALCGLLSRLNDTKERVLTCQILTKLSQSDSELLQVAEICADINAWGARLDEPDHDRRDQAFAWIYGHAKTMTPQQWSPVVHNCLYFLKDTEDRVSRSSASHCLDLFVQAEAIANRDSSAMALLETTVLERIERGMLNRSELVRTEYLSVLGSIIKHLPDWRKVSPMRTLTAGGDEEASFFSNVLHIQQHRRLRALRRLAEEAQHLNSHLCTKIFLPLIEHFVFDQPEGDTGRTLADQSVITIGALAKSMSWSSFRATFKRYVKYLTTKEHLEKTVLRLLGAIVNSLSQPALQSENGETQRSPQQVTIIEDMLPPLVNFLHQKDESTVDRRMPVAVTIVKLLRLLQETEFSNRLPALLMDVCHVLKSRSQEARDQARKTLAAIASLVGPAYFGFILKELRSVLKRGYQLHVLSFTVHLLLVDATDLHDSVFLESCLPDLMAVITDDIFGVSGQEKDAEEYKTGMKEIKSSKSFDSMELLAKMTPIQHLGSLVHPIRSLLRERLDIGAIKKVDDLLARLRKGLDQNPASDNVAMLTFCWEIVDLVYRDQQSSEVSLATLDPRRDRFLVRQDSSKKHNGELSANTQTFKLRSFALNLARKIIRRHDDLKNPSVIIGFLPIAGDALLHGEEEVKLAALKFLSTIMNLPLGDLASNAPVYLSEAVSLIKSSPSMTMELPKAALELIVSVLRDLRSVEVKERDIALLLKRLKGDVDEPDRQTVIYKFLRAVLGRKIVIAEVYEVMDEVGNALVTNPDRSVREAARSAYVQFILDYPQGRDRWNKQAEFVKQNLKYEHPAGRQSVMELLNQLLSKLGDGPLQQQFSSAVYVPLVLVLMGDSDTTCREMAAMLIGRLFEYASKEQLASYMSIMNQWVQNDAKPTIKAAAIQCWTILIRARQLAPKQLEGFRDQLETILSAFVEGDAVESSLALKAIQAFAVLVETTPTVGFDRRSGELWTALQQLPPSAGIEIQEAAVKLLGGFLDDIARASSKLETGLAALPLRGSGGLEFDSHDLRKLCKGILRTLRFHSAGVSSDTLLMHGMHNLTFLGRCFAANEMPWFPESPENELSEDGDEDEVEEEEEQESENAEESASGQTRKISALVYLFSQLSAIIRQDKFSTPARLAAMQCEASVLHHLPDLHVLNLQHLLRPLHVLVDPSVPQPPGEAHKQLVAQAHELLELVQKKLGPEAYVAALAAARRDVKQRRDARRQKRKIAAVSAPENWARQKRRKHEAKKTKQRLKNAEARGTRKGW